jgi:hypothetical protein
MSENHLDQSLEGPFIDFVTVFVTLVWRGALGGVYPANKSSTSEMGHSRHVDRAPITSGLPRLTDVPRVGWHVSKVPISEVAQSFDHLIGGG